MSDIVTPGRAYLSSGDAPVKTKISRYVRIAADYARRHPEICPGNILGNVEALEIMMDLLEDNDVFDVDVVAAVVKRVCVYLQTASRINNPLYANMKAIERVCVRFYQAMMNTIASRERPNRFDLI